jgi:RNA-directed DNA polymerase
MIGAPRCASLMWIDLANVDVHDALDLWYEKIIKKCCKGEASLISDANDCMGTLAHQADAIAVCRMLAKRLGTISRQPVYRVQRTQ